MKDVLVKLMPNNRTVSQVLDCKTKTSYGGPPISDVQAIIELHGTGSESCRMISDVLRKYLKTQDCINVTFDSAIKDGMIEEIT